MKRIILFFTVCLGLSVFQTGFVVAANTTRASVRRNTTEISPTKTNTIRQQTTQNRDKNGRTSTIARTTKKTTAPRTVSSIRLTSSGNTNKKTVARQKTGNAIQGGVISSLQATPLKVVSRVPMSNKGSTRTPTRVTTLNADKIAAIKSQNYSKCKSVYYDCMDEFCATKDASLRRCACSSRIHEFDAIKKQLNEAEDKMLDFNQRLLVVGLDKEDAAAINVASDGEKGYSTKDTSGSEKLLRKITNTLNSSGNSKINNDLSPVSLSLNVDSAWDSIDSVSGIATTSKNGIDLYNAARPMCVKMAQEVCSEHELEVTQESYQLLIQQDCNTVAKSYDTKYNQAMEKIHESSALLDMSRLNAHQQRNSDDILTCKKKILEKMSDSSVCGENLHKCLDVSGQYIDPSTGNAFLSNDLYKIMNLLTPPSGNITWSNVPQNQQFVTFLNSKKVFLKSATDQCQDIADAVWADFLNDALAQIKLAQNAKVEEIRQSCTTLVSECKTSTRKSLQDFDARALSTFQVIADATTNALCANVENSCVSLLNASGGGETLWQSGMSEIARDTSYDAIIDNCTTVGRDCIIQQCNGTAGNFALCSDFASVPRRAILRRQACWDKVLECINQATNLSSIRPLLQNRINFYTEVYNISSIETIPNPCSDLSSTSDELIACQIAEQIWGNCEYDAESVSITTNANLLELLPYTRTSNKILIPISDESTSLLSWLASNTGTTDAIDSCSAYNCPINYQYNPVTKKCSRMATEPTVTTDGFQIITLDQILHVTSGVPEITNRCVGGVLSKDMYDNCCASGTANNGICVPSSDYNAILIQQVSCDPSIVDLTVAPNYYCSDYTTEEVLVDEEQITYYRVIEKNMSLYCITQDLSIDVNNTGDLICNGYLVLVDEYGNYMKPQGITSGPSMSYNRDSTTTCTYVYDTSVNHWNWNNGCTDIINNTPRIPIGENENKESYVPKANEFTITYN